MSLGVGPGDEVVTTPFTFISTIEVIALLGAKPVLADVEIETGNIDARLIESIITERTKAIIPVSLYGQTSDMDVINQIAQRHNNIPVIEDAAQSFGAIYRNTKSCNLSSMGCTSFFPSKPLGCFGDGGAIFTNDDKLAEICREIRIHGQSERYIHKRIGVGGRMDTMQCAILLSKMEVFEDEVVSRVKIGKRYNDYMDSIGVDRILQKNDRTSVFAQYTIRSNKRDKIRKYLESYNIPTAIHYPRCIHQQPGYAELNTGKYPIAELLSNTVLSLPMSPYITEEQQDFVCSCLSESV